MQVLYLGRAPCTKESLPDFREKCRVTRYSRVFRGLTGSQRTPWVWGVTKIARDRQKSYGDNRYRDLQFEIGDRVFLKIFP